MAVKRADPYRNFPFRVEIDTIAGLGFSEVLLGASRIEVIEYREGADPTLEAAQAAGSRDDGERRAAARDHGRPRSLSLVGRRAKRRSEGSPDGDDQPAQRGQDGRGADVEAAASLARRDLVRAAQRASARRSRSSRSSWPTTVSSSSRRLVARGMPARAGCAYDPAMALRDEVRVWTVRYRAHNGSRGRRTSRFRPMSGRTTTQPLPLVISPTAGVSPGRANLNFWGDLPARGRFAVISPEGHGRGCRSIHGAGRARSATSRTCSTSRRRRCRGSVCGRMRSTRWVAAWAARRRSSSLRDINRLLKGAASFDAPTDLARRYRDFPRIANGQHLQELARREVGGTPDSHPGRVRAAQPDRPRSRDRVLARAAAALLEHRRRGRPRSGAPLGAALAPHHELNPEPRSPLSRARGRTRAACRSCSPRAAPLRAAREDV